MKVENTHKDSKTVLSVCISDYKFSSIFTQFCAVVGVTAPLLQVEALQDKQTEVFCAGLFIGNKTIKKQ